MEAKKKSNRKKNHLGSPITYLACGSIAAAMTGAMTSLPAKAEIGQNLPPINLAQTTLPSLYPTDVTPTPINQEREFLKPGPTYYFYRKLPPRFWFNISSETSQRYEANVFQTTEHYKSDYVFRELPNITAGYNILDHTSIYTNYFVIKDVFANYPVLTFPTTQSLSLGIRHEKVLKGNALLQFDFQSRELWLTTKVREADLIPGVTLTKTLSPRSVVFANVLLQMRGGNYFVAPTRELDPFYSIGYLHSHGSWVFSSVATLVTNFRHPTFPYSVPYFSNNSIIVDMEVSHPISSKLPNVVAFIRAEPIWNFDSHAAPGTSGFDFRLFGGLRITLIKPEYHSTIKRLKQSSEEDNTDPNKTSHNFTDPNTSSSNFSGSNSNQLRNSDAGAINTDSSSSDSDNLPPVPLKPPIPTPASES